MERCTYYEKILIGKTKPILTGRRENNTEPIYKEICKHPNASERQNCLGGQIKCNGDITKCEI